MTKTRLMQKDEMRDKNEQATGVYKTINEDCEQVFNTSDRFSSHKPRRKILVTNALTYANNTLHLGHLIGYVQADIWSRFQKMNGHDCVYIGGSDGHGTPIMIRAEQENKDPVAFIETIQAEQQKICQDFLIDLNHFYTTHSEENKALAEMIYARLQQQGDIIKRTIEQAYDPIKKIFLPDRYVKGECPKCGAKDQYGDSCEVCSATYSPMELKNPVSALSGQTPVTRTSEHYFFRLSHYESKLKQWSTENHLPVEAINKLNEWFEAGLQDWDISRDAPYFGFKIPETNDKYFYVWFDAPIGYFSILKHWCQLTGKTDFNDYLDPHSNIELYHFIGKDIMYFHTLFWPAVLMSAELKTPTKISIHGFLTIDGQKMSKSRGTFIKAQTYLDHLHPEYFRYYAASKLTSRIEDIDLNLEDFRLKINADLVGKVVNLASRCAGFIQKHFDNRLSDVCENEKLIDEFKAASSTIATYYEEREFAQAIRLIMQLADRANQYIDEKKPWVTIKDPATASKTHAVCTMGLNLFRLMMIYLKPILPEIAVKTEAFLNIAPLTWNDVNTLLLNHPIHVFVPLMQRIDPTTIETLKEAEKNHV